MPGNKPNTPNCRLCGGETREVMRERVLGKHDVAYLSCVR